MLVAVAKFTRWIKATPVTTQDSTAMINLSSQSYFVLVSLIASLQIMEQLLHPRNSRTTVKVCESSSTFLPLHTHRQTVKSKKLTA
jgi:hypothetical protein